MCLRMTPYSVQVCSNVCAYRSDFMRMMFALCGSAVILYLYNRLLKVYRRKDLLTPDGALLEMVNHMVYKSHSDMRTAALCREKSTYLARCHQPVCSG